MNRLTVFLLMLFIAPQSIRTAKSCEELAQVFTKHFKKEKKFECEDPEALGKGSTAVTYILSVAEGLPGQGERVVRYVGKVVDFRAVQDPAEQKRVENDFNKELTILKKVKSRHVIKLIAAFTANGYGYELLEFAYDGCLADFYGYNNDRFDDVPFVLELMAQILEGLKALHRTGWIHCDIKPDNVVVHNWQVKLIDMDLASPAHEPSVRKGTPVAFDPRFILNSDVAYDEFSDIYAFGIMIFQLINGGKIPFDDSDTKTMYIHKLEGRFEMGGGVHWLLGFLTLACLNPNAEHRPTVQGILDFINSFLKSDEEIPELYLPEVKMSGSQPAQLSDMFQPGVLPQNFKFRTLKMNGHTIEVAKEPPKPKTLSSSISVSFFDKPHPVRLGKSFSRKNSQQAIERESKPKKSEESEVLPQTRVQLKKSVRPGVKYFLAKENAHQAGKTVDYENEIEEVSFSQSTARFGEPEVEHSPQQNTVEDRPKTEVRVAEEKRQRLSLEEKQKFGALFLEKTEAKVEQNKEALSEFRRKSFKISSVNSPKQQTSLLGNPHNVQGKAASNLMKTFKNRKNVPQKVDSGQRVRRLGGIAARQNGSRSHGFWVQNSIGLLAAVVGLLALGRVLQGKVRIARGSSEKPSGSIENPATFCSPTPDSEGPQNHPNNLHAV